RPFASRRANVRGREEGLNTASQCLTGVGASSHPGPIPDQCTARRQREAAFSPRQQIRLKLTLSIARQGQQTRLVEFGLADEQRLVTRVVVADIQTNELAAAQATCIQQHDRESEGLTAQW